MNAFGRKKDLALDLVRSACDFFILPFFIFFELFSDVTFVRNMNGSCYLGAILRWHRHNANGSCYARFLPQKLPKTVLLRTAAHDFSPNLRVTRKNFFPFEQGPRDSVVPPKKAEAVFFASFLFFSFLCTAVKPKVLSIFFLFTI